MPQSTLNHIDLFPMRTNQLFTLLPELATFVQVVDSGSFSAAARQLGATPSAISRSIARLERELNTRLMQRTTRKLRLSDSGAEVYKHAQDMMRSLAAAVEAAGKDSQQPAGKIRISAPRALGRLLIHPLIPEFLSQHPEVDLVFRLEDRYLDLIDEQLDIAFRITDEPPPGMMGRRLMRIEHVICATPEYLATHGHPAQPQDLKHHSCLTLTEDPVDSRWRFTRDDKTIQVDIQGRYTANHTGVRMDAVLHNLGIGSLPLFIAAEALRSGQVVQVLPEWTFKTNYYGDVWMLYPRTRHLPPKLRAFVGFIAEKLGSRNLVV